MTGAWLVVASYAIGSISFGLLLARRAGVDLREVGSGNAGATNAGRVLGAASGRRVMVLDAAKGALAVALAIGVEGSDSPFVAACGLAAAVGHCLPLWHGLRGGKGAATGLGAVLVAAPLAGALAVVAFFGSKRVTGYASVGSLTAGLVAAGVAAVSASAAGRALASGTAGLLVVTHAPNLARLARGTEPRASDGSAM